MEVLKITMASSSMRMILNPRCVCSIINPRQMAVNYGDRVEGRGYLLMAWRMVARDHSGLKSTGSPRSGPLLYGLYTGVVRLRWVVTLN